MNYLNKIYEWLLPSLCILCHEKTFGGSLCQACYVELPWLSSACVHCANPLSLDSTILSSQICGTCLKKMPPYASTLALFHYQPPVDHLILSLKFGKKLLYAKLLGDLMAEKIAIHYENRPKPNWIFPIPLHINRLRERGFNQALELARPISQKLKIPINHKDCQRILPTFPQALVSAREREKNMRHVFSVAPTFKAEHVALVDDVVTTGNTVAEVARVLINHGVGEVDVWCCARTSII